MIGLYRNGILFAVIIALLLVVWTKAEHIKEQHDARVSREAVTKTITKIETANANAVEAGKAAAEKSVAPPLPPARKPSGRVRKPVAGAVVDPTAVND